MLSLNQSDTTKLEPPNTALEVHLDRCNRRDVELILREKVGRFVQRKGLHDDMSNYIAQRIINDASGCLLWADIVLARI